MAPFPVCVNCSVKPRSVLGINFYRKWLLLLSVWWDQRVAMNDSNQADLWEKPEDCLTPRPTSTPKNIQLFLAYFIGDLDQVPIFHSEFWPITL